MRARTDYYRGEPENKLVAKMLNSIYNNYKKDVEQWLLRKKGGVDHVREKHFF